MRVERVFEEILGRKVPRDLDALLFTLRHQGFEAVEPLTDPEDHPFVLTLGRASSGAVGLLIWPTPQSEQEVPVVRVHGHRLELLASTARDYVREVVGSLDHRAEADEALLSAARGAYSAGESRGLGLEAWLLTRGGGSPAVHEVLVDRHLGRGDLTAALITRERCADLHGGWAEPAARRALLLSALGRRAEARDAARVAMALPRWTLLADAPTIAELAEQPHRADPSALQERVADASLPPADRAAWLLDLATLASRPWSGVRPALAALYAEATLAGIASLVQGGGA